MSHWFLRLLGVTVLGLFVVFVVETKPADFSHPELIAGVMFLVWVCGFWLILHDRKDSR